MLPEEDKEPVVIIDNAEPEETDTPSQVVIDLEKKPEPKTPDPKVTPKPSDDFTKLHNTIAYQNRKLDQAMREMQEMRKELTSRPQTVQAPQQNLDEIDEIAQKDWKQGVKKVVEPEIEKRVEDALKKRDEAKAELDRRASVTAELEKSKQRVISKYPTIEDDSTEEASIYRQVVNEDPSLLSNIHGPEIAMYRMEDRMREMGRTPPSLQPAVDREVSRLARAGASSVIGRTASKPNQITLTKDQKEFCDRYKIPYDRYVKNLKASANGGVEA